MGVAIEITGTKEIRSLDEKLPYNTATYAVIGERVGGLLRGSVSSKV